MASYSSYKKVNGDQLSSNSLTASSFSESPNSSYGVNGSTEPCVGVRLVVVATGQFQLVYKTCGFRLGVLEEMVLVHVHVTDVITIKLLKVDTTTLK